MIDLVSIVVPVYNAEKYLSRGIACLTNQTYKKIEIILVDDCSSDNSLAICNQLAMNDSRIKVLAQKTNLGSGMARNRGIDIAKGEFITFFDADDIVSKDAIRDNIILAKRYHADVVMWKGIPVTDEKVYETILDDQRPIIAETADECRDLWIKLKFYSDNVYIGAPWNKLYRANLFKVDKKLRFPNTRRLQDSIFNLKVFDRISSFVFNQNIYSFYFYNDQSTLWKKLHKDFAYNVIEYCRVIESTICSWEKNNANIQTKLDNELIGYLYLALAASQNPKWKLSITKQITYIRDVLSDKYLDYRLKDIHSDEKEFNIWKKILKLKNPYLVLMYIDFRPSYFKWRHIIGTIFKKMKVR